MSTSVSVVIKLFDDESVREKITVMSKWDAACDDERNACNFAEQVEDLLVLGKSYRITIEEVNDE